MEKQQIEPLSFEIDYEAEQLPEFTGESAEAIKEYQEYLDNGGLNEIMDEWLLEDQRCAEIENFNEHEQ